MRVYVEGFDPATLEGPGATFGGTTPKGAELDEAVLDGFNLRAPLEALARALIEQNAGRVERRARASAEARGMRVVGVHLCDVTFTYILAPAEPPAGGR